MKVNFLLRASNISERYFFEVPVGMSAHNTISITLMGFPLKAVSISMETFTWHVCGLPAYDILNSHCPTGSSWFMLPDKRQKT